MSVANDPFVREILATFDGSRLYQMRLIIAGGRDYVLTRGDAKRLDALHAACVVVEVVSGGATGADAGGEKWAAVREIPVKRFQADWENLGSRAGPTRNMEMALYADAVVLFPGGRGTDNMHAEAMKAGIGIWDWREKSLLRV